MNFLKAKYLMTFNFNCIFVHLRVWHKFLAKTNKSMDNAVFYEVQYACRLFVGKRLQNSAYM